MNKKLLLPMMGQPDPRLPKDVHLVGRYALGVTWGDGHGSIYPFDRLRQDCACGSCAELDPAGPLQMQATEIEKDAEALQITWADSHLSVWLYDDLRGLCRCAGCTGGH